MMISNSVVQIADKAKDYLEENKIYSSKSVCYGYSQKLVQLVIEDCIREITELSFKDRILFPIDKNLFLYFKQETVRKLKSMYAD